MDEDPITFAIKDKRSWIVGVIAAAIVAAATMVH